MNAIMPYNDNLFEAEVINDLGAKAREYEKLIPLIYDRNGVLRDFREDYFELGVKKSLMEHAAGWLIGRDLYAEEKAVLLQEARRLKIENDQLEIDQEIDKRRKLDEIDKAKEARQRALAAEEAKVKASKAEAEEADRLLMVYKTIGTWTVNHTINKEPAVSVVDLKMNRKGHRKVDLVSTSSKPNHGLLVVDVNRTMVFLRSLPTWNHVLQPWFEGIVRFENLVFDDKAGIHRIAYVKDQKFIPFEQVVPVSDSALDQPKKKPAVRRKKKAPTDYSVDNHNFKKKNNHISPYDDEWNDEIYPSNYGNVTNA